MQFKAQQPKIVTCPGCGGDSVYASSNAFRPFCSAHCKNLDFGAWASENFRVPTQELPADQVFGDPKLQ
ncbi:MAG: DNA gyrase inhibitor YacG [Burkholderiaceae bacterium]